MSHDARTIADTYFRSWRGKDFTTLRSLLADDVTFRGPLGRADDAETYMRGMKAMAENMTHLVIHHVFVDGTDVVTWFDLHTTAADPVPTANWTHIEDGRIKTVRVTFDPRPLLAGNE